MDSPPPLRQSGAMTFQRILLVGCGNMAGAMLDGWLAAGVPAASFTVADPNAQVRADGVTVLPAIPEQGDFDAILLGVKPQILRQVASQVERLAGGQTTLLSILAGVETDVLATLFPRAGAVVRMMPNLSAALGKSPIALAGCQPNGGPLDGEAAERIVAFLKPLGTPEWIDEQQFDLVTALAGSGPAFVYRFIDALAGAATELGLSADTANALALATVEGASALAAQSPFDPAELARRVASPGGTTQAGLDAMDAGDRLRGVLTDTLRAARDRSAEMAAEARNNS